MKQGDYVSRISYKKDLVFRIEKIKDGIAILRGVDYRLLADAPLEDLVIVAEPYASAEADEVKEKVRQFDELLRQQRTASPESQRADAEDEERFSFFEVPGKVLHLDGDPAYLRKSLELYRHYRVPVEGHHVEESRMADLLYQLLPDVQPDIVVITGHDGIYKNRGSHDTYQLGSYKNSLHFARAVQMCRQFERNRDVLTVIAGACQSHFEALLQAGANFASSPARILIHALDPVQIASKVSYTSIRETVNIVDVFEHTVSGLKGMGGIECKGSHRMGLPNFDWGPAASVVPQL